MCLQLTLNPHPHPHQRKETKQTTANSSSSSSSASSSSRLVRNNHVELINTFNETVLVFFLYEDPSTGTARLYFPEGFIFVQPNVTVPYVFSTTSHRYWIHVRTAAHPSRVLVGAIHDDNSSSSSVPTAGSWRQAHHPLFEEPLTFEPRYFNDNDNNDDDDDDDDDVMNLHDDEPTTKLRPQQITSSTIHSMMRPPKETITAVVGVTLFSFFIVIWWTAGDESVAAERATIVGQ